MSEASILRDALNRLIVEHSDKIPEITPLNDRIVNLTLCLIALIEGVDGGISILGDFQDGEFLRYSVIASNHIETNQLLLIQMFNKCSLMI